MVGKEEAREENLYYNTSRSVDDENFLRFQLDSSRVHQRSHFPAGLLFTLRDVTQLLCLVLKIN